MAFASNNLFNPPAYDASALQDEHDIKQAQATTYLAPEIDYDEKMRSQSPIPPDTPHRGSNESSPTQSIYSDNMTLVEAPTKSAVKTLDIFHTKSHYNMRIYDQAQGNECLYYVDNSCFTPKKPDVILFKGSEKQGYPIAGVVAWASMYSKLVRIGLGDAGVKGEKSASVPWEDMKATSGWKQNEHRWKLSSDPTGTSMPGNALIM